MMPSKNASMSAVSSLCGVAAGTVGGVFPALGAAGAEGLRTGDWGTCAFANIDKTMQSGRKRNSARRRAITLRSSPGGATISVAEFPDTRKKVASELFLLYREQAH